MSEADWLSLKKYVLERVVNFQRDDMPGYFSVTLYSRLCANAFKDFQKNNWAMKYRAGRPYYDVSRRIKSVLKISFIDLPKYVNKKGLLALVVKWRLEVGK